jgi:Tfp pilus assembly protein PilV
MNTNRFQRIKGQSLFEMIVAVLIVSLVMIALVSLSTKNLSLTAFSRNKTLANRHSQEALEWVRGERDKSWNSFVGRSSAGGSNWCVSTLSWATSGACGSGSSIPNSTVPFLRNLTLRTSAANTIEVTVVTSWVDGSGTHESRASTTLTNWKKS